MAVASSPEIIALPLIADIVRKTCAKYTWDKSDSTYKTFLKHLNNFAKQAGISLEDMASSSISHARDIDYSTISKLNYTNPIPELTQRFQNIPYVIYVDENNISTVIIKKGNVDCPITEITMEMMQVLSYLGIVRIFSQGRLPIPGWSDNIIHLDILTHNVIQHLDEHQIPFPKYLRGLIDHSNFIGTYTNRLPPHLITLSTACTETRNLSPTLKEYSMTGITTTDVIASSEYLPLGIRQVIYSAGCAEFHGSEITMPPGTEYLEIGLDRIYNPTLIIRNVKKLFIHSFNLIERWKDYDSPNNNLTFEHSACNDNCCNYYKQHVEVILEEGIEHLVINIMNRTRLDMSNSELLKCIQHIPSSLQKLSILDKTKKILEPFSLDTIVPDDKSAINILKQHIQEFITRFPHIEFSIESTT